MTLVKTINARSSGRGTMTDDSMHAKAARAWDRSYRHSSDPDEIRRRLMAWVQERNAATGNTWGVNTARWLASAAMWAHFGFRFLQTGHKFGAALMSTSLAGLLPDDVVLPAPSFIVRVPSGLLPDRLDRIFVTHYQDRASIRVYASELTEQDFLGRIGRTLVDLLEDDAAGSVVTTKDSRVLLLAARLVVGLCVAMQHTNNFRALGYPGSRGSSLRDGPPAHRVVAIGRPIDVDCRDSVRSYLRGDARGGPPSVQTLVRGHYKRQVVGISRAGRKVVWIEPYWRGPEKAPILSRPYRVGAERKP